MEWYSRRSIPLLLLVVLLVPIACLAEDKMDVSGGFFKKNMVNEMFGQSLPATEQVKSEGPDDSSAPEATDDRKSFEIPPINKAPLRSTENTEPAPRAPASQGVEQSLKSGAATIEHLKRELADTASMSKQLESVSQIVDAAKAPGVKAPEEEESLPSPRAMFGRLPVTAAHFNNGARPGEKDSLSVILLADSEQRFLNTLVQIQKIAARGVIPVKKLYIIGFDSMQRSMALKNSAHETPDSGSPSEGFEERPLQLFDAMSPSLAGVTTVQELQDKYHSQALPVWLVESEGLTHVFPGEQDPSLLFRADGAFVAENRGLVDSSVPNSTVVLHRPTTRQEQQMSTRPAEKVLIFSIHPKQSDVHLASTNSVSDELGEDGIVACATNQIRRVKVPPQLFRQSSTVDVVFYSGDNSADAKAARSWRGAAIDFETGILTRAGILGDGKYTDLWRRFAGSFRVRCLPTRFHFTQQDGARFLEYREGPDSAWELDE